MSERQDLSTGELYLDLDETAEDIDCVMDTFPIVKRKVEAEFGEHRSKRRILEEFAKLN